MTKSVSVLNKLTVGQMLSLVYPEYNFPFYYIVENGSIQLIEEGMED